MPLDPGERVRIVVLNSYGRYETIDPIELSKHHQHYIIDIIGLPEELETKIKKSEINKPYGVAGLDADGKIGEHLIRDYIKDKFKIHVQSTASTHWTINHEFNRRPNVIICNSNWQIIMPHDIHISNNNTVEVFFNTQISGYAILT